MEVKDKSTGRCYVTNKVNKIISKALVCMDAEESWHVAIWMRPCLLTLTLSWWSSHRTKAPGRGQAADLEWYTMITLSKLMWFWKWWCHKQHKKNFLYDLPNVKLLTRKWQNSFRQLWVLEKFRYDWFGLCNDLPNSYDSSTQLLLKFVGLIFFS